MHLDDFISAILNDQHFKYVSAISQVLEVSVDGVKKLTPPPHLAFNAIRTPSKYVFL